jgi:hypothetical protein
MTLPVILGFALWQTAVNGPLMVALWSVFALEVVAVALVPCCLLAME